MNGGCYSNKAVYSSSWEMFGIWEEKWERKRERALNRY